MNFKTIRSEIVATSVYARGEQVGVNVPVILPAITPETVTVQAAGGKIVLPIWQQLTAMEATVTLKGLDDSFLKSITPRPFDLIVNSVQTAIEADGTSDYDSIKAYMRVIPKSAPAVTAATSAVIENKLAFSVLSYKLEVNGQVYLDIDVPKGRCIIDGNDYMDKVRSLI